MGLLPGRRKAPEYRILNPARVKPRAGGSPSALTASGAVIRPKQAEQLRRLIQSWQPRAFGYYDGLGEIKYAAQFYARNLAKLELFAGERDPKTRELVPTENKEAQEALARIQDPGGGGCAKLLYTYGQLMFLAGEAYLTVSKDPETDEEQWEMLSTDEIRPTGGGGFMRVKAPSLAAETLQAPPEDDIFSELEGNEAVCYRIWKKHPHYSMLPDSTMFGVLEVCEELTLLAHDSRARLRSRLASSGILLISEAFSPAGLDKNAHDENPDEDVFIAELTEAMMKPITDEGTPAAIVPFVVRANQEAVEKGMRFIQLVDPARLYPEPQRYESTIRRLAIGLDMPAEILLGMAGANHWTGWLIDETAWQDHLEPVADAFVDDVGSAYFRPALRELNVPEWQKYEIGYDASKIVNHPDRSTDAKDLYDREAISKAALRDATGFDEDDAMPEDERKERIGIKVRDGGLAIDGVVTLRSGSELEPAPGEIEAPPAPGGGVEEVTPSSTKKAAPAQPQNPEQEGEAAALNAAAEQIMGACTLALARSREAAGNRIRSLARKDAEMSKLVEGKPTSELPSLIGPGAVRALAAEASLVTGVRELLAQCLAVWGLDVSLAGPLAHRVEQHALRTLYSQQAQPFPPAFRNYIVGILAAK